MEVNRLIGVITRADIIGLQNLMLLAKAGHSISHISILHTQDYTNNQELNEYCKEHKISIDHHSMGSLSTFQKEKDYDKMEAFIFRWYLLQKKRSDQLYVHVGGGHTFVSLAMHRAAYLFGAKEVFHVFVKPPPNTRAEIEEALIADEFIYVSLGEYEPWPVVDFIAEKSDQGVERIDPLTIKDRDSLRLSILELTKTIQTRDFKTHAILPFDSINLLPSQARKWLAAPFDPDSPLDQKWIHSLPKTDLHTHLGGFATHGALLHEVRQHADNPVDLNPLQDIPYPDTWPLPGTNIDLGDYMKLGNNNGSYILSDPGCLNKHIELLYDHFVEENIRYAEVRCSPDNYKSDHLSAWEILEIIRSAFQRNMESKLKNNPSNFCHVNLIIIATRRIEGDLSSISRHLALAITANKLKHPNDSCQIVGVDLAGYESKETRAAYFQHDFRGVHRSGVAVTAHAGENDDVEGIWQAIYNLHARRLGHALRIEEADDLRKTIVDRRIGIEMCPYANYQIKGFKPKPGSKKEYPLKSYLRNGVMASINTDNIGISNASISDNFLLAAKMNPDLTKMDVLQLLRNSLEIAFIPNQLRQKLLDQFNKSVFEVCYSTKE